MNTPQLIAMTVLTVAYLAAPVALVRTKHGGAGTLAVLSLCFGLIGLIAVGVLIADGGAA